MFFEGAEKKLEVISRSAKFRAMGDDFWCAMVETSGAKILSTIRNDFCDAHLLSESSLFVWDDRLTMITCGTTTLGKAAEFLLEKVPAEKIDFMTYERKNEYYPYRQQTDFFKDVEAMQKRLPGKVFRFGSPDEHHVFLYHLDREFKPQGVDATLEILMYNLQGQASEIFNCNQTIERVRQLTKLDKIFPDFQIDDHVFQPCGYSLNAIRGPEYYTIHVTPEEIGSYVSFETNVRLGNRVSTVVKSVVDVFQPASFDVVYFHSERELKPLEVPPFIDRTHVRQSLSCGFEVSFSTYFQKSAEPRPAVPLEFM